MLYEYQVEIEECLCRTFRVRARDAIQAVQLVEEKYYEEEIVLNADDCMNVFFSANPVEKSDMD